MNLLQQLARTFISLVYNIGIRAVELFYDRSRLRRELAALDEYPAGSLSRELADCLRQHGLRKLPWFASHDLKHVLLGYGMTPVEETRLQAFMIGNGNYSIPALALFGFGALLLPEEWPSLRQAYVRGKTALPISSWTIRSHGHFQADALRGMIFEKSPDAALQSRFGRPRTGMSRTMTRLNRRLAINRHYAVRNRPSGKT
jgi:hypothetical protein